MTPRGDIFLLLLMTMPVWGGGPRVVKPAQAGQFLEASGRRAVLLGTEDGTFEAWLTPIKVASAVRLAVYVDGALEPTPLAALARTVEVTAAEATIVHAQAAFTVRQRWVAHPEEAAAAVLLDVETSRPLRFRMTLTPEMKPMWPASFGGQSTGWDAKAGVLAFGEGQRRFRPVIGSPRFSKISEQIGHQMPERAVQIEFEVEKSGRVPILIAGSRAIYDRLIGAVDGFAGASERRFAEFLGRTTGVEAEGLTEAFTWGKLAIERGWSCPEKVGCGLVAGWGISGASERPGFGWFFGGDTMMSAWAMTAYGDFEGARAGLEFLIERQRADGKIMHEWTQSAALLDWPSYPYGYYHADTTPLFLFTMAKYLKQSGDRAFLEKHWGVVRKAYAYCLTMADKDDLLSNEKGGAAAVETGALSGKVRRDVYLQGVWLAGLNGLVEMAGWRGDEELQREALGRLERARAEMERWYVAKAGLFAFAELKDGTRYEANSGWQAMLVGFGGMKAEQARGAAAALARPTLATGWGTRLFATDSPYYDPLGYNDGSVWPFVTAQAIVALYRNGQEAAGWRYLQGMAQATGLSGAGFLPEYFSGDRFVEGPRAVPHQLFSSVAVTWPVLEGMLGFEPDGFEKKLRVRARLGCGEGTVKVTNYRVGAARVTLEFEAGRGRVLEKNGEVSVEFAETGCVARPELKQLEVGQGAR